MKRLLILLLFLPLWGMAQPNFAYVGGEYVVSSNILFSGTTYGDLIITVGDSAWNVAGFYLNHPKRLVYRGTSYGTVFAAGENEASYVTGMFPYNATDSADIIGYLRISPLTDPGAGDTVVLNIHTLWERLDGSQYVQQDAGTLIIPLDDYYQYQNMDIPMDTLAAVGNQGGSIIEARVYRQGSHTSDTYAGGLHIPILRYRYQISSVGSQ